jgi:DNA-binding transcriptional LysR family regulator
MKIFVTVCKYNSVTIASKKLFLTQPAVSLAISELEAFYGIRLFDRISRKLYLTDRGKQLLEYAVHITALFEEMETRIRDWDTLGSLRIGSSITIGNHLLPGYVEAFKAKYPQIRLQIKIENSEDVEKRIVNNELDLAFIEGAVHHPQIIYEKFMDDRLVLICGRVHPLFGQKQIQPQDLSRYDFLLREKGSGGRELFDSILLVHNIRIEPIWESISTQAIIRAVIKGFGLSVLPYLMVKPYLEEKQIGEIEINGISLSRNYYVIYHRSKYLTNSARDLISICKTAVL